MAGWMPGPDGIRVRNGEKLALDLVLFADYANLGATLQGQLHEVGIGLDLKIFDIAAGAVDAQPPERRRPGGADHQRSDGADRQFHSRASSTVSGAVSGDPAL